MDLFNILFFMIIIAFGCLGFSRGLTKQIVIFIGTIIVLIIAYELKSVIGDFFLLNLPFIKFSWGISSLNILFYQGLAFFIIVILLEVVLKILIAITSVFEKILKYTIILGIPSKLLGMLVGFLEGYVFAFLFALISFIISSLLLIIVPSSSIKKYLSISSAVLSTSISVFSSGIA